MPYNGTFLMVLSVASISAARPATSTASTEDSFKHTQTEQTRQDEGQQQQGEANGKLSAFANGWPEGLAGGSLPEFGERCGRHGCKGDVG